MDKLIKENSRIKELMSYQVQPYTHRVMTEAVGGAIDDILTSLVGKFKSNKLYQSLDPKVFDDIFAAGKASPTPLIRKELKNIDSLDTFVQNIDEFSDDTLRFVFRQLAGKGIPEVDAVLMESISEILTGGPVANLSKLVGEYNSADEFIEFMQKGSELPLPKFVEDSLRRFFRKESIISPDQAADYIELNIKKLAKAADAKGGKTWFRDYFRTLFAETKDIRAKIETLSTQFADEMETITDPQIASEYINAYSVAISRELNRLEMKANQAAAEALSGLDIDSRLRNVIQNSNKDTFKIFRELRREDPSGFSSNIIDLASRFFNNAIPRVQIGENIKNMFNFRKNILKNIVGDTPNTSNIKKNGVKWIKINWPQDLKQYLITGQWAKFSNLYKFAIKNSSAGGAAAIGTFAIYTLIYSEIGSLIAHVIYDVGQALSSTLNIQLGINKIFTTLGLDPLYPNAEQDAQEEFASFIEEFFTKASRNLKETFAGGEYSWAVPFLGTFEKSALSKLLAWVSGNPKGYGVTDVWNILKGVASGLWEEIPEEDKDFVDELETTTLVLDWESVKNAAPEDLKEWIWTENGKVYIMADKVTDYEVMIEDNEYVVKVGNQMIKLSEYKK